MITVREARDADKENILTLFAEVFGPRSAARTNRLWHWQWQLDPRLMHPGYRGVVAEWQGRLIGNISYIPASLYVNGQPITASWGINVVIHWGLFRRALRAQREAARTDPTILKRPADLGRGLAAALINHRSNDPVQLGKHISQKMLTVTRKIGFNSVESSGSWGRQLSLRPRFKRLFGGLLGPVLAWPVNRMLPGIARPSLAVSLFEGDFDARFDGLWDAAHAEFDVIGLRDARTLNWRFRRHPTNQYTVYTLADGLRLRGYAVTTMVPRGRFQQGRIVDLLAFRDDPAAVRSLLSAALLDLRKSGAAAVDCYASHDMVLEALKSMGFTGRQKLHQVVVRGVPHTGLYVTELDADGG